MGIFLLFSRGIHGEVSAFCIWWSEDACIDVSDPAALDDVKKVLESTIGVFKDKVPFVGAWFRTRSTNWPMSFADETLARFGADQGGAGGGENGASGDPSGCGCHVGGAGAPTGGALVLAAGALARVLRRRRLVGGARPGRG